jgi:hypothetical protein
MTVIFILTILIAAIISRPLLAIDLSKHEQNQKDFKDSAFLLPKSFGNQTLAKLADAPPCGTILADFNGIPSYSNGEYQGTGVYLNVDALFFCLLILMLI